MVGLCGVFVGIQLSFKKYLKYFKNMFATSFMICYDLDIKYDNQK